MARPVVALLTDFGLDDHYVGTMKGVVLSVCPEASLVDITHGIEAQDIARGAAELAAAYRYFPTGTVFLVVVDPGVGSSRRAIAAEAAGYRFVGPDNGVFSEVFRESPPSLLVELTERKYTRAPVSHTFEGRDRFAAVAGWMANETPLRAFGPVIDDYLMLGLPEPTWADGEIRGEVMRVDRFGNLITNITVKALDHVSYPAVVSVSGHTGIRLVTIYADVAPGAACALVGSSGYLEIAVSSGNAARVLGATRGERVRVSPDERRDAREAL
jgi:S-adenosylmethionine hydrolase